MERSARVEALLDAAVSIVAAEGLRGLTHRAVDGRAGVPPGSTSYYFRTRRALLEGLAEFLAERDMADVTTALAASTADSPLVQTADVLTEVLVKWLGPARERTRARLEIFLLGSDNPDLTASLRRISENFLARGRAMFEAGGAPHPDEAARLMQAMIEGMIYNGVARPPAPDRAELRRAVEAVIAAALEM